MVYCKCLFRKTAFGVKKAFLTRLMLMVGLTSTLNQRFEYIKIEYSHISLLKEIAYESVKKRNITAKYFCQKIYCFFTLFILECIPFYA